VSTVELNIYLKLNQSVGTIVIRATNTKLGKHTVHGSRSACIDLEVKTVKVVRMWCWPGCACQYDCLGFLVVFLLEYIRAVVIVTPVSHCR